jgi:hypothetical protein
MKIPVMKMTMVHLKKEPYFFLRYQAHLTFFTRFYIVPGRPRGTVLTVMVDSNQPDIVIED